MQLAGVPSSIFPCQPTNQHANSTRFLLCGLRLPRCVSTGPGVVRLAEFANQLELKRACKDSAGNALKTRFRIPHVCGPDKRREREICHAHVRSAALLCRCARYRLRNVQPHGKQPFLRGLHDGMRQMWRQSIVQSGHAEPAFGGDRICSSFRNRRFSMSLVARKARALSRLPRLLSREARGRSLYEVFLSGLLILLGGHSAASSTPATTKTAPTPPKAATAAASAAEIAAPTASRSTKTAAASAPAATPASASTPYASKPTSAN
jgi:hypothetical protein